MLFRSGVMDAAKLAAKKAEEKTMQTRIHKFDASVESAIEKIEEMLVGVEESQKRFFAIKIFERDDKIGSNLSVNVDADSIIKAVETDMDEDSESIITNERYVYISSIIDKCIDRKSKGKMSTSDKIDRIVTNRIAALLIFAVVMYFVYWVSVSTLGGKMTDWTNDVLFGEIIPSGIEKFLGMIGVSGWIHDLIMDGIVAGVGAVLGFVPQMLLLFIFLGFLEGCDRDRKSVV